MKKIGVQIGVLLCCMGCSSLPLSQAYWHDVDFDKPANFVHKKNELTLSVSNDATTLYVEIGSYSAVTVQKIKHLGLSLWISKGKSPRKNYGIHYPLPYADAKGQVALEGFSIANLVAVPLSEITPIHLKYSFSEDKMNYHIAIPLAELGLNLLDTFTIEVRSFEKGNEEYLSALTAAEAIERRLDEYKANPINTYKSNELIPFFETFKLAKKPNKNL